MPAIPISASASGNTTLVAAEAGRRIRVRALLLTFAGAVNAQLRSGPDTPITGLFYGATAGSAALPASEAPDGWAATAPGAPLVLNLSAAVAVGGTLVYTLE